MTEAVTAAQQASRDRQNKINQVTQRAYRDLAKAHPDEYDSALKQHALDLGVELPPKRKSKEERDAESTKAKQDAALAAIIKKAKSAGLDADAIVGALDAS